MDRLEEIRQHCEGGGPIRRIDMKYLLSEVDRLNALHKREIIITGEYAQRVIDLTARAEAAEAERDACKADLQSIVTQSVKDMEKRNWTPPCRYCSKYFVCDYIPEESGCCFEWRGPQEAGEGVTENERKIAQATAGRERLLG